MAMNSVQGPGAMLAYQLAQANQQVYAKTAQFLEVANAKPKQATETLVQLSVERIQQAGTIKGQFVDFYA